MRCCTGFRVTTPSVCNMSHQPQYRGTSLQPNRPPPSPRPPPPPHTHLRTSLTISCWLYLYNQLNHPPPPTHTHTGREQGLRIVEVPASEVCNLVDIARGCARYPRLHFILVVDQLELPHRGAGASDLMGALAAAGEGGGREGGGLGGSHCTGYSRHQDVCCWVPHCCAAAAQALRQHAALCEPCANFHARHVNMTAGSCTSLVQRYSPFALTPFLPPPPFPPVPPPPPHPPPPIPAGGSGWPSNTLLYVGVSASSTVTRSDPLVSRCPLLVTLPGVQDSTQYWQVGQQAAGHD
jgi:hypothetical protein